jgi:FADH2 O2-dependent halogenase
MPPLECDLAVIGSGFGGTLLALIAQRLGMGVVLLERGAHPRFAIGESSTPLADYKLAAIADHFGLDWLRPFAKYGPWKATYPQVACGLKRGFSFFRQQAGRSFVPRADNANLLLVAASPDDARSDTHWFRADFDAHLVGRAVAADIPYLDRLEIQSLRQEPDGWHLEGIRPDEAVTVRAGFVVDATGDGGLLGRTLGLEPVPPAMLHARSRALYGHLTEVTPWQDVLEESHGPAATAEHPYPCDAAALHHVLDGGWMWVLRFDNGITSAGFALDPEVHPIRPGESPEAEWARLLHGYPSLERQFAPARPVRPLVRTGRLQRRWSQASGRGWALLPHAAGFLDPWLSPGIAQTLFAVARLGRIFAGNRRPSRRDRELAAYDQTVLRELAWVDEITAACFACFDRFEVLVPVTFLYFAAAVYCEVHERTGRTGPDDAFLLADDPAYREIASRVLRQAPVVKAADADRFTATVCQALGPYNLDGLGDAARHNLYPYVETAVEALADRPV